MVQLRLWGCQLSWISTNDTSSTTTTKMNVANLRNVNEIGQKMKTLSNPPPTCNQCVQALRNFSIFTTPIKKKKILRNFKRFPLNLWLNIEGRELSMFICQSKMVFKSPKNPSVGYIVHLFLEYPKYLMSNAGSKISNVNIYFMLVL